MRFLLAGFFNDLICDCSSLALAETEGAPLVTAVARLVAAADALGELEVRVLGEAVYSRPKAANLNTHEGGELWLRFAALKPTYACSLVFGCAELQ